MSDNFSRTAAKLAGLICRTLGWRPHDFWSATPAEIASILFDEAGDPTFSLSRHEIEAMMERDTDG